MLKNVFQKSNIWYTKEQAHLLNSAIKKSPFLTEKRLALLTKTTGANKEHVKAWFRNDQVPEFKKNSVLQQVAKSEKFELSKYGQSFLSSKHFSSVTALSPEPTHRHFSSAEKFILKKCHSVNEKPTCEDLMILAELFKTIKANQRLVYP